MLDCSITSNCSYSVREQLKELTKQYDKSEDDLKALQSVGQVRDWPWTSSNICILGSEKCSRIDFFITEWKIYMPLYHGFGHEITIISSWILVLGIQSDDVGLGLEFLRNFQILAAQRLFWYYIDHCTARCNWRRLLATCSSYGDQVRSFQIVWLVLTTPRVLKKLIIGMRALYFVLSVLQQYDYAALHSFCTLL